MASLNANPKAQQLSNVSSSGETDSKIEGNSLLGPELGEFHEEVSRFSMLSDDAHESTITAKTWVNPGETYGSYEEIDVSEDNEEVANLSTSVNSKEYVDCSAAVSSHRDEECTATATYDSNDASPVVSLFPESRSGDSNNISSQDVSSSQGEEDNTASTNDSSLYSQPSEVVHGQNYINEKSLQGYQHEESRDETESVNDGRSSLTRLGRRFKKGINLFDTDTVFRETAGKDGPDTKENSRDASFDTVSMKNEPLDFNDQENMVRDMENSDITKLHGGRDATQSTFRGQKSDQKILHESKVHENDENMSASKSSSSSRNSIIDLKKPLQLLRFEGKRTMSSYDTEKQSNKKTEFFSNKIKDVVLQVSNDVSTAYHSTNDGVITVSSNSQNNQSEAIVKPVIAANPIITVKISILQHTQMKKEPKTSVLTTKNEVSPAIKQKVVLVRRINDRINNALKGDGNNGHIQERKMSSNPMDNNKGQTPMETVSLSLRNAKTPAIDKKDLTEKNTSKDTLVRKTGPRKQQIIEAIKTQPIDGVGQEYNTKHEANDQKRVTEQSFLSDFSPSQMVRKLLNSVPKKGSKEIDLIHSVSEHHKLNETQSKPKRSQPEKKDLAKCKQTTKKVADNDVTSSTRGRTDHLFNRKSNTNDEAHINNSKDVPINKDLKINEEVRIASSMPQNGASIHSEQQRLGSKYVFDQHDQHQEKSTITENVAVESEPLDYKLKSNKGTLSIHHNSDDFKNIKRGSNDTKSESLPTTKDLNLPKECERGKIVETHNFSEDEFFFQKQGIGVRQYSWKENTKSSSSDQPIVLSSQSNKTILHPPAPIDNPPGKAWAACCSQKSSDEQKIEVKDAPKSSFSMADQVEQADVKFIRKVHGRKSNYFKGKAKILQKKNSPVERKEFVKLSEKSKQNYTKTAAPAKSKNIYHWPRSATGKMDRNPTEGFESKENENYPLSQDKRRSVKKFEGSTSLTQRTTKAVKTEKKKEILTFGNLASEKNPEKQRPSNSSSKADGNPAESCHNEILSSKENIGRISHIRSNQLQQRFDLKVIPHHPDEEEEQSNLSPHSRPRDEGLKMNSSLGLTEEELSSCDTVSDAQAVISREHESQDSTEFFDDKIQIEQGIEVQNIAGNLVITKAGSFPLEIFHQNVESQGKKAPTASSKRADRNRIREPVLRSRKGLGDSDKGRPILKPSLESGDVRKADTFSRSDGSPRIKLERLISEHNSCKEAEQVIDRFCVNDKATESRSQPLNSLLSTDVLQHSKAAGYTFNNCTIKENEKSSCDREKMNGKMIYQCEDAAYKDKVVHAFLPSNSNEVSGESSLGKNEQSGGALPSKSGEITKNKLIAARLRKKSKPPDLDLSSDDMRLHNIRVHHNGSPGVSVVLVENKDVEATEKQPFRYMGSMTKGLKAAKEKLIKTQLWTKTQPMDHEMFTGDVVQGSAVARRNQSSNSTKNKASGLNGDDDADPVMVNERKLPQRNVATQELTANSFKAHDKGKAAKGLSNEVSVPRKNSSLSAPKSSGNDAAEKIKHAVSDAASRIESQGGISVDHKEANFAGELAAETRDDDVISQLKTNKRLSTANVATDNSKNNTINGSSAGQKKNSAAASLLRSAKEEKLSKKKNNVRFESSAGKEKEVNIDTGDVLASEMEKKSELLTRASVARSFSPGLHENNSYCANGVDVFSFVAKKLGTDFYCAKLSSTLSHESDNGQDDMKIYGDGEGHELTIDDYYLKSESEEVAEASAIRKRAVKKVVGVVDTSSRKSSKSTPSVKSRRQKLAVKKIAQTTKHPNA